MRATPSFQVWRRTPADHICSRTKRGVALGNLAEVTVTEDTGGFGENGEREPVPRGQHLVVGLGRDALRARVEEHAAPTVDAPGGAVGVEAAGAGEGNGTAGENVASDELGVVRIVKVALAGDAEDLVEGLGIVAEQVGDLLDRPEEELAFDAFAVGVLGAVEAALFAEHLAFEVGERLAHDALVLRVAEELEGVQVDAGQLGVVVEHLLEVGHEPLDIDAVAGEATADLVVHAAAGHAPERAFEHGAGGSVFGIVRARGACEQELKVGGGGELGRGAETAPDIIGGTQHGPHGVIGDGRVEGLLGGGLRRGLRELAADRVSGVHDVLAALAPGRVDGLEEAGEAGTSVGILRWEIGAPEEGLAVRRQEERHGPAALAGEGLHGGHVDAVDVGTLLAVDLDVDEVLVHDVGGLARLEGFVGHDVAPVAGAVAHRKEDGLVLGAGLLEGLIAPGVPVDGVLGVLQQVGAGFVREAVWHVG